MKHTPITREQAEDMSLAHAQGYHSPIDGVPREGCPDCEDRPLSSYPRKMIHKAEPAPQFAQDAVSTCVECHREIRRVPGGQGTTWVHADTGAVVG